MAYQREKLLKNAPFLGQIDEKEKSRQRMFAEKNANFWKAAIYFRTRPCLNWTVKRRILLEDRLLIPMNIKVDSNEVTSS